MWLIHARAQTPDHMDPLVPQLVNSIGLAAGVMLCCYAVTASHTFTFDNFLGLWISYAWATTFVLAAAVVIGKPQTTPWSALVIPAAETMVGLYILQQMRHDFMVLARYGYVVHGLLATVASTYGLVTISP